MRGTLIYNLESCRIKWKALANGKDLLMAYKSRDFLKLTENTAYIDKVDMDFMIMVHDNITIYESGRIIIKFYDGTKIEYCWFGRHDALICGRSFFCLFLSI